MQRTYLRGVEADIKRLAIKARDGQIVDDMTGELLLLLMVVFFGSVVYPILIHHNQRLGMHNIEPIAVNGKVEIHP
jgi:2-oxoglutarate dehydrogenase E2 component (dihydrolipoamide succinyltransferase)